MFKKINEEKMKLTIEMEPELAKQLKENSKKLNTTQRIFIEISIKKLIDEVGEHNL